MACFDAMVPQMPARPTTLSVSFGLDRLATPIGIALLVTDAAGALRALDWEDYEHRMRELLRLHYGAVELSDQPAPPEMRTALTGYLPKAISASSQASHGASPARRSSRRSGTRSQTFLPAPR
ncbi:hypothetical protein ACVWWR_003541 [Bradyrhizobium sp. LM3.2]